MPKFQLLLLDTGVVIELHRLGLWEKVIEACSVTLTRTIAEDEAQFWEEIDGEKHYFDVMLDIQNQKIKCVDVPLAQIYNFIRQFDPSYFGRIDPGEKEALAYLCDSKEQWILSSTDAAVFKVLGRLHRGNQGISLEELLQKIGLSKGRLDWKSTKEFRRKYTVEGEQDLIRERGLK